MKVLVVLLSVIVAVEATVLLTPNTSPPVSRQIDKTLIAKRLSQVSVTVLAPQGMGSGILLTRHTKDGKKLHLVLTAAHVVQHCRTFVPVLENDKPSSKATFSTVNVSIVVRRDGRVVRQMAYPAEIVQYSNAETGRDLAILKLIDPEFPDIDTEFALGLPDVGSDLYHVGSMFGLSDSFTCGVVSQVGRIVMGKNFDQVAMTIYPGSSGGGVFNAEARCVGIAVLLRAPGLGFIVPAREVHAWSIKAGCRWLTDPTVKIDTDKLAKWPVENDGSALPAPEPDEEKSPGCFR